MPEQTATAAQLRHEQFVALVLLVLQDAHAETPASAATIARRMFDAPTSSETMRVSQALRRLEEVGKVVPSWATEGASLGTCPINHPGAGVG